MLKNFLLMGVVFVYGLLILEVQHNRSSNFHFSGRIFGRSETIGAYRGFKSVQKHLNFSF